MRSIPAIGNNKIEILFPLLVVAALSLFLWHWFDPQYIFLDTTPTGGDIPAHNYLVKHLKENFFSHGRIIAWAKGWWCGFPMYQYYFFFPYWLMAALSLLIPMNIAFKIVSILGIIFLPPAVFVSLRWMKFEKPVPLLGALAMVPFLFVDTHTMWGVNIYSTLAGEIANSISFVFFVLFIGSFFRDMMEARFRARSVALFTLLFFTHFFTSLLAGLVSLFFLFLFGKDGFTKRIVVYAKTNGLTFLLIAWWFLPLFAKRSYSMEFGGDWDVSLLKTFPPYAAALMPPALVAAAVGVLKRNANLLACLLLLALSVAAFHVGGKINPSFTNIRFWPFIFFSLMILAAGGLGWLVQSFRAKEIFVTSLVIAVLTWVGASHNNVRAWVKWNYEGLENKSEYAAFKELVLPLHGTPGRLANDLHEQNNRLGSTRVFETVPYLIDKEILEGGLVNSAAGSMFSYYIQGETSKSTAGFPTVVNPAAFNIDHATKHLSLANVKHFIARWEKTQSALLNHPEWRLLKASGSYQLFELSGNDGKIVYIPKNFPMAVKTDRWKESAMEWLYIIEALEAPFILHYEGESPSGSEISGMLTEDELFAFLSDISQETTEIPVWLSLGPFYFKPGIADEEAADLEMIDLEQLEPRAGHIQFGHKWKPILRRGPIFIDSLYQPRHHLISYHYVNIRSERDQKALLHFSNDDHARIYLNGERIVKAGITGLRKYGTQGVQLKKGDNPLIYKLEQGVGGAFFHARLTGPDGRFLKDVRYLVGPVSREFQSRKAAPADPVEIREETVTDRTIRFKTSALHQPHIIKVSYFPNWKVKGARRIYHVTPNFMLVYPEQEEVTLYYGSLPVDHAGRLLTLSGVVLLGIGGIRRRMRKA